MDHYVTRLSECFTSIAAIMGQSSTLVQLVAFSNPVEQVDAYLAALQNAGLKEVAVAEHGGRFWRTVPNRKWYAKLRGGTPPSKELLLVYKRA